MDDTECRGCGSPMVRGGVCPVCELPDAPASAVAPPAVTSDHVGRRGSLEPRVERAAPTVAGRLWQSGQLAIGAAAACFAVAMVVPLVSLHRVGAAAGTRVAKSPLSMILGDGPFGLELRSSALMALPAAAFALVWFLASRRTRSVMFASRPLVLAVVLIPLLAAGLQILKLGRRQRFEYSVGPAVLLIGLGAVAGAIGAARFGRGKTDPPRRRRIGAARPDDDHDDDAD